MTKTEEPEKKEELDVEQLPFPFAYDSQAALWMWCFENVMRHPETPLTDKTLKFINDSYKTVFALWEGRPIPGVEVVK